MNDQTATILLDENEDVEAETEPRVAGTVQHLAEAIQFAADLELGFNWYHEGPAVIVNTRDEAVMRVLRERGARTSPYKPDARVNPGVTAWEIDLARIGDFAKYIAMCIRDGERFDVDSAPLRDRLVEVREQVALETQERERLEAEERERQRLLAEAHSNRFRQVANRYPRQVTDAYHGDIERAAADSDEQVAATVAAWERAQGLEPLDWSAIGAEERDEVEEGEELPAA